MKIPTKFLANLATIDFLVEKHGVTVDLEDLPKLRERRWAITNYGYVISDIVNKKKIMIHRFLMNPKEGEFIDHINRNKLDNRKSNLRICSYAQNSANRTSVTNKIIKGIRTNKKFEKYEVRIKQNNIGYFTCFEAAKNAYNFYAKQHFGEFAYLNPVEREMSKEEFDSYRSGYSSLYNGVFFLERRKSWWAAIQLNGRKKSFEFSTEKEAAIAMNFLIKYYNLDKELNDIVIA